MEIPNRFNSDFTSDPNSQHMDAILILRLPRDSGLTQNFCFENRLHTKIGIKIWDKNVDSPPRLWTAAAKKSESKEDVSESTKNYEKN